MHWGHCVSSDLIKWEDLPVALAPDEKFDEHGCFSGSAIETDEGHILVYTGLLEGEENGRKLIFQNQCIALGDGKNYKKYEKNPVVNGRDLPDGFSRLDFRDPKIWYDS